MSMARLTPLGSGAAMSTSASYWVLASLLTLLSCVWVKSESRVGGRHLGKALAVEGADVDVEGAAVEAGGIVGAGACSSCP